MTPLRYWLLIIFPFSSVAIYGQAFDTSKYVVHVSVPVEADSFFRKNPHWKGGDGAASIDLENGNLLWLFSDTFINQDSSGGRKRSSLIRNSVAIQEGYDLARSKITFYWNQSNSSGNPDAFFSMKGPHWLWTGHGIMVKDKLIIFLLREEEVNTGLGFKAVDWEAVIVSNPHDNPLHWKMSFLKVPETFGTIVGSASVLKDDRYVYAFGSVEPVTHEVYLLRWKWEDVYRGHLQNPQWWFGKQWKERKQEKDIPESLFTGATEYSVYYDSALRKFIQIQAFGFGKADIGIRMSDRIEGKWSNPFLVYTPDYSDIKSPLMYAVRAHPEIKGNGLIVTYNINSSDLTELLGNQSIYFPKIIQVRISPR